MSDIDTKDKKSYELALLLKNEDDLAGVLTLVAQHGGEMSSEPRAKKLALAYKIKGETEAIFAYADFLMLPEHAKELEHDLATRQNIIRSMIIIAPPQAEHREIPAGAFPMKKRGRPAASRSAAENKPTAPRPLSNEALEKKIEEILQ